MCCDLALHNNYLNKEVSYQITSVRFIVEQPSVMYIRSTVLPT